MWHYAHLLFKDEYEDMSSVVAFYQQITVFQSCCEKLGHYGSHNWIYLGIMVPSSAYASAPNMETTPQAVHTISDIATEPVLLNEKNMYKVRKTMFWMHLGWITLSIIMKK